MNAACRPSFAALLRQILLIEQKRKLKDVAEEVGLSARNFYGRVTGRIQFTPEEINRVLCAVPDPRLAEWLLSRSGLICIARQVPAAEAPAAELALRAVDQAMAALRGVLHGEEVAQVMAHAEEAQRQLAALQASAQ